MPLTAAFFLPRALEALGVPASTSTASVPMHEPPHADPACKGLAMGLTPEGTSRGLYVLYLVNLAGLSISPHKEFRLLISPVQVIMPVIGAGLRQMWGPDVGVASASAFHRRPPTVRKLLRGAVAAVLVVQCAMWSYFSLVHQRGAVSAVTFLASEAAAGRVRSVYFLMPCHSTQYHAYIHQGEGTGMRLWQGSGDRADGSRQHRSKAEWSTAGLTVA